MQKIELISLSHMPANNFPPLFFLLILSSTAVVSNYFVNISGNKQENNILSKSIFGKKKKDFNPDILT